MTKRKSHQPTELRARGRPSNYSLEMVAEVCGHIAEGCTLRKIAAINGMPGRTTILRWLARHEDFRVQYARACELRLESFADEIIDISDDGSNDYVAREGQDGQLSMVPDHDHIARSRLRVDSRKWLMVKLLPKKYGGTLDGEGGNGSASTVINNTAIFISGGGELERAFPELQPPPDETPGGDLLLPRPAAKSRKR